MPEGFGAAGDVEVEVVATAPLRSMSIEPLNLAPSEIETRGCKRSEIEDLRLGEIRDALERFG